MSALSVTETLRGREILLTGASGFVGKVWMVMTLMRVPDIGRLHLLVRPNREADALGRIEKIVNTSPAFEPLHAKYGDQLAAFLRQKVVVHAGDITKPTLGLDPTQFQHIDLVVGCAASVDFTPDTRFAVKTNIHGAMNAAEFASQCGAALVQVSTCFVNGRVDGRLPEQPLQTLPNGKAFDPEKELAELEEALQHLEDHQNTPMFDMILREATRGRLKKKGKPTDDASIAAEVERTRDAYVKNNFKTIGTERAHAREWPNTYTYTKGVAEGLLFARYPKLKKVVVRPAVVESARAFPFPGWNEGFNTCGPLAYLIGTWFKALPGREDNPFDVVPVDMVCEGITLAATAVLNDCAAPVYQCGTSDLNVLTLGRANELTGLAQRKWLRKNGKTAVDRLLLSRADTTVYDDTHPMAVSNLTKLSKRTSTWLKDLPEQVPAGMRKQANKTAKKLDKSRRTLHRVNFMVEAFTPFTRDLRQVFVSRALATLDVVEPEFRWDPAGLNWRDYWMNVHMPGMRKWSFPLFEKKTVPTLQSPHQVTLQPATEAAE